MKLCAQCGIEKPLDQYYSSPSKRNMKHCVSCNQGREQLYSKKRYASFTVEERAARVANHKVWREKNRGKARHWRLVRDYGIGIEEYRAMLKRQNGVCAICQVTRDTNYSLHVDHCHDTGKVRGLLCGSCNKMLGLARDDRARLARAAEYLDRFKELCQ